MIADILVRAYNKEGKKDLINLLRLNTPTFFSPDEEKEFVFYLDNEIENYFIADYKDIIMGAGGITIDFPAHTGYISWDIIHTQFQGKGVGSLLINHRLHRLKSNKTLDCILVRTPQLARKFYEKSGFSLIEQTKDYWAKVFDLYKMKYNY